MFHYSPSRMGNEARRKNGVFMTEGSKIIEIKFEVDARTATLRQVQSLRIGAILVLLLRLDHRPLVAQLDAAGVGVRTRLGSARNGEGGRTVAIWVHGTPYLLARSVGKFTTFKFPSPNIDPRLLRLYRRFWRNNRRGNKMRYAKR